MAAVLIILALLIGLPIFLFVILPIFLFIAGIVVTALPILIPIGIFAFLGIVILGCLASVVRIFVR